MSMRTESFDRRSLNVGDIERTRTVTWQDQLRSNLNIMVDSIAATLEAILAGGGEVAQPIGADAPEITARFRDPAGNIPGLYQQPT